MKKKPISILVGILLSLLICFILIFFNFYKKDSYLPMINNDKKWRIGYYEGGEYKDYQTYLITLVEGLSTLGWLNKIDFPVFKNEDNDNTKLVWDILVQQTKSEYIEFVEEAYWSAEWYDNIRKKNKEDVIKYLQEKKLDLIIAGGTWGGLDLANNEHNVPVLVISTSDPIQAGIIKSAKDSGYDHVHAVCDPDRYLRQLRAFHNIINFEKLGVVYENTDDGKVYAALNDVIKISLEGEFDVVTCIAADADLTAQESMEGVYKCHEELAQTTDAVYITAHRGVNPKWMPGILKPLFDHKIPTFAQEGPDQVKHGVLLSIARVETEEMGLFQAKVIGYIFNGKKPRDIDQIFEEPKRIVINLEAAKLMDIDIPESVVNAADKVYDYIESD